MSSRPRDRRDSGGHRDETCDRQDGTWREVRHHAYIGRPFGEVCRMPAAEPERIIGHPEGHERAARLPLHWEDARNPRLFPVLDAALELPPLQDRGGSITRVGLVARYRVPLGPVGAWADGGVIEVVIDSVTEVAVIDYDASACTLVCLLGIIENDEDKETS